MSGSRDAIASKNEETYGIFLLLVENFHNLNQLGVEDGERVIRENKSV